MTTTQKMRVGFALLTPDRRREIASMGGKTAHREGRAHTFTSEEASAAGKRGAAARQAKRMAVRG